MKNDDTHPAGGPDPRQETESRIVAWLLGEADAAEAARLEALVAADPALAELKASLEKLLGLVAQAEAAEASPAKLPEGRRAELLRALSAPCEPAQAEEDPYAFPALEAARRRRFTATMSILAAAACLTLGVFLSVDRSYDAKQAKSRVVPGDDGGHASAYAQKRMAEQQRMAQMQYDSQVVRMRKAEKQLSEGASRQEIAVEMPASAAAEDTKAPELPVLNNARQLEAAPQEIYGYGAAAPSVGASVPVAPQQDAASLQAPVASLGIQRVAPPAVADAAVLAPTGGPGVVPSPDAPSTEGTVALSPLVATNLDTGAVGGKRATSMLAGTRVRTDAVETSNDLTGESPAGASLAQETPAARQPLSTFSLRVGDASFKLAAQSLEAGEVPDPAAVRPEEFYNAFDYGDPAPAMAEKVSCHVEQAAHPFDQQRNLVRIAMRVPETGRGAGQPLSLTLLLDTSGSMERADRAAAVRRAVQVLVSLLGSEDRVTLVGFSRRPRLLADAVPGDQAAKLLDIVSHIPPEGGTNVEEAIRLAGQLATREFRAGAQNRIVLLTDGAANLGDVEPSHLSLLVGPLRQQGISFDACGVGTNGIDDAVLEALARMGAGRYYILGTPESADAGFARQIAGALRPAAENVKVQVRFNPSRVGNYRLIGFEQDRLAAADFRNDQVGTAALAHGESAVAVYEVEPLAQGDGELGEVTVRFRDTASGETVERGWTLPYDPAAPSLDRAGPAMQLAGAAALIAEKLHGGPRADSVKLARLAPVMSLLRERYSRSERVQQLASMYDQMRRLHLD